MKLRTDNVTLEILKSHFVAIAEGMAHALERTSHSTFVKESADFVTALASPHGEFFAYPRSIGVSSFLGFNLRQTLDAVGDCEPGDVVISNDPYGTQGLATHLPDIHLLKPLFEGGELIAVAWCFIHCSDVGGLAPASISPRAEEIHQEGLRIPPRMLFRRGQLDEEFLALFLANSRSPEENWGDLKAMIASVNTAERRMRTLIGKFGEAVVRGGIEDMLDWSEGQVRAQVRAIPDGRYAFADYLDDDTAGTPVRLAVTLVVRDDEIVLDYSGTDPQVQAAYNLPGFGDRHPFLLQGLINFVLSEEPSIPLTGGIVRPFTTIAPRGSVVNPEFPAAVGVRYATVIRLYNVVLGALAQAVPDKVPAAGAGAAAVVMLSVPRLATGERQVAVLEPLQGGGGATSRGDGVSGNDSAAGFLRNTPVESLESHVPVLIERYELLPDSAGVGLHRGGWGTRIDFRILQPESIVTARGMERCRFEPWGLAGGGPAERTRAFVNPGTADECDVGRINLLRVEPGDVVSVLASGGGGYGDPLDRDPHRVAADVTSGLLDPARAGAGYGVVLGARGVDEPATAALRSDLRVDRPATQGITLGPARLEYERRWPPALSEALTALLFGLPVGLRAFAKREIHRHIDAQEWATAPPLEAVEAAWREIARTRLDQPAQA